MPRPSLLDGLVAMLVGCAIATETLLVGAAAGPDWANVLLSMLVAAPLVVRRSRPVLAAAVSASLAIAMTAWLTPLPDLVTPVVLMVVTAYAIGAWSRRWWWLAGVLVQWAGLAGMVTVAQDPVETSGFLIVLAWSAASTAVGRVAAGWHERLRRTADAVAELEGRRDVDVRLTAARERLALASTLHDSVAHAMTVVCLQAGAAQRTGDTVTALDTIARTASTSLAELRAGLDDIEAVGHPLERSRITALGRRVGVEVAVTVPDVLPAGTASNLAFRVVREAVVNVARHAPGSAARVVVDRDGDGLLVEVLDDGRTGTPFTGGTGTGLSGLADAVARIGGRLDWGPRAEGGFRVAASIPAGAS